MPPSREKALESLYKAQELLAETKENLKTKGIQASCLPRTSPKDGWREKSHACVARYLEEKYRGVISEDAVNLLDRYRSLRHNVQYETSYSPSENDAWQMVAFAEEFVKTVKKIIV